MDRRQKKARRVKHHVMPDILLEMKNDIHFKFLIIGDFGVGKTAIVRRYTDGTFSPSYKITIGADFEMKHVSWDDNTRINLQLWDIAGNEKFGYMNRVFYRCATAAVVVFDLTRNTSMESVSKWLHDLREKVTLSDGSAVPVVLLANKSDMLGSAVPTDSINKLCTKLRIDAWFVTSAKENVNIDKAFRFLIARSLQVVDKKPVREGIVLDDKPTLDKSLHWYHQLCCK